jgi:hypothetical protein
MPTSQKLGETLKISSYLKTTDKQTGIICSLDMKFIMHLPISQRKSSFSECIFTEAMMRYDAVVKPFGETIKLS